MDRADSEDIALLAERLESNIPPIDVADTSDLAEADLRKEIVSLRKQLQSCRADRDIINNMAVMLTELTVALRAHWSSIFWPKALDRRAQAFTNPDR